MLQARNSTRGGQDRPTRCFGRDITNYPKPDPNTKKALQKPLPERADPITHHTQDIINFLHTHDSRTRQPMQEQGSEVTDKMRQILIDWLVDVHQTFTLKQETLHLALHYLNDYQARRAITKEEYQLVGITCLWIASKYEEIYPPRMKSFVEVTAYTYSAAQLKQMESNILKAIDFNLTRITPLSLLLAHPHPQAKTHAMAKYLLELAYLNGKIFSKYGMRTTAAAAVRLGENVCGGTKGQSQLSEGIAGDQLQACHKELCLLLQLENKYKLSALKRKFTKEIYLGVGKIRIDN